MSKRKGKKTQDSWPFAAYTENDSFIPLFRGMMDSEAYKDLKPRAHDLLIVCYRQRDFREDRIITFDGRKDEKLFYLNNAIWRKIGLYTNPSSFRADMQALITHGFIDCVYDGHRQRKKSIYKYSDRWKTWTPETKPPISVCTDSLVKKIYHKDITNDMV